MRILLAEDERITRRSLQRRLEGWGHDVVAAEDGEEAWGHYQEQQFDLVVTDWDMPRCDGRELIDRIRKADTAGYVYLIMLTSRSEKTDVVAGMEAGPDDFLAKPFDRDELRVRLNAGERIIRLERELAAQNAELGHANDRMKRDLDAAAEVQQHLLPRELPETGRARFAWYYEPCDELGGDILDVLPLNDRSLGMYLLDVTGHGVPAALLSVMLSKVLSSRDPGSSIVLEPAADGHPPAVVAPRDVAAHLNRRFPMEANRNRFFTLAYAVLDTETGLLRYTLAGQPPPVVARRGRAPAPLDGSGFPIGVVDDADFEEYTIELEPGDRVYFYSDGITEAANEQDKMLGVDGLLRLIGASPPLPLQASLDRCIDDLKRWCDPVPFGDDISALALEIPDS